MTFLLGVVCGVVAVLVAIRLPIPARDWFDRVPGGRDEVA